MFAKKNIYNVFIVFLISHLALWTLIPSISNINLPLDTIEALAWGSDLDWGFNKHPPLSAIAVEIIYQIFGNQDWAYYLLSQIFVVVTFFVVYKFSEDFFGNNHSALISVLLLEGIYFFNFTTPEFNVNVCQFPFWALSVYYTWKCIKYEKAKDYFLLGVFVALGILSKYLFIYLVIGIKLLFIFLITKKKIKVNVSNYLLVTSTIVIILLPHIFWLIENNYQTIVYGLKRTGGNGDFIDHIKYPLLFLGKQTGILIPFFIMSYFLIKKIKLRFNFNDKKLIFLIFTVISPIFLIFITSAIMGANIRTMWMTPFYIYFGMFIVFIFNKAIQFKNLKKFFIVFLFFFILSPTLYLSISLSNDQKRTDYPGKEIARPVQNKWDDNFKNEIRIVIGDEWYAGNLSYHLYSRPKWILSLKDKPNTLNPNDGVIYTGNPKVLKQICPGEFGTIKPVGYCMIGQK